jgi:hypothetical protein
METRSIVRRVALVVACSAVATACDYFYAPFLNRIDAPVVITGAEVPALQGVDPVTGVGYRWESSTSNWSQIPIQIDQRHVVAFGTTPPSNATVGVNGTVYGYVGSASPTALQYSDPNTFVGADPNPMFDADDELVFMARDAGGKAPAGTRRPAATTGSGIQLIVTDTGTNSVGYVYLYRGTAGADPSAGLDYVDYTFALVSGNYKTTYRRNGGPNPESSTVTTPGYTVGLDDRWFLTDLAITDGSGVDILDGHKSQFAINFCGRSNQTFANEEGAFVANIDGPVRGIRSYVGANSGPLTQRTEVYYRDRFEMVTNLRVHAIPSVMSFVDFAVGASGMSYGSSAMAGVVPIDGIPDTVPATLPNWSYVTGPQGTLLSAGTIESSASITVSNFYLDDSTPASPECWGDGGYRGANGALISGGIANTDPRTTPFATFRSHEYFMPMDPSVGAKEWAPVWHAAIIAVVTVTGTPF